jgi:Ca2+/Na+ antiporter
MPQLPGGEITEVQLLQLFLQVNADIDTQFQFWISVTFAVLVASFVADERLSRVERGVISGLYLCAATILLYRYLSALSYQRYALDLFTHYGVEQPAQATTAGRLRLALFTLGSLVAAMSVLFPGLLSRRRRRSTVA